MKRYVIAFDSLGVYFRENLCTIHRGESGEVHYHTKPIKPTKRLRQMLVGRIKKLEGN